MTLRNAARIACRELRGGLQGFRIFLLCLTLGVAAIAGVGSIRAGIEAGLARDGAILLGGDAEIELVYRFATPEERAWLDSAAIRVSEIVDFRSMAVAGSGDTEDRALTQVKGVDGNWPLVGEAVLDPAMPIAQALAGVDGLPGGVMDPLLADRMALAIGDTFRLGTREFRLMARLIREPDSAAGGFALGPRTVVGLPALADAGLLAPGTLYETKYRLDLPDGTDLATAEAAARAALDGSGLRWRDARNGAPGVAEFVDRLGAFLILVGLSGLAVGGIGVSAAVRAYIAGKTPVIATLRTLGADRRTVFLAYFLQIGALAGLGIVLGLLLGALVPVLAGPLMAAALPVPAVFAIYPGPLFEAAVYGALTALVFTLWPLSRTVDGAPALPRLPFLIATAVAMLALLGTAILFSGTWQLTLGTFGGLAGALAVLAVAAIALRTIARRARSWSQGLPALRWSLAALSSPRGEAGATVLSLGLGLSVLAAIGQIDGNLQSAITRDLPAEAPTYFFVDIQKDQVDGFLARTAGDPGVSRVENAPMLRGVITRINDRPAAETAGDHWVLQGDRGVTYATTRPGTTRVTEGAWWAADYTGPPQISFAAEEAAEMNLTLGDTMTVNILGRDVTGTVTSFREVDFSTAGMGFLLAMNDSALSGAPHTFIATVYADAASEAALLRDVSRAYPNVTAIRVRDAIDRVSELLSAIGAATRWGAAATLLTGMLVLIGAAAAGQRGRVTEAALLKTLGATRGRILRSFALRAALLGLFAGLVAVAAGIAGGWAVSRFVMNTDFAVIWPSALGIVGGGVLATLLAGLAFAWAPLQARPAQVLRSAD
jgi:putative ABC transport system permease protein